MYNRKLIQVLTEIRDVADILGEIYREKAYRRAVSEIKKLDFEITKENVASISKIPGVGAGIMDKITEFIKTGHVKELERAKRSREFAAWSELSRIIGVGPATIKNWRQMGINSLASLRRAISRGKIKLNHMQTCGLRYYKDLNTRIPHDEVYQIGEYIRGLLLRLDPHIIFTIAGSYRRGTETSGDIDILVSNKKYFDENLLRDFLEMLKADPNFIDVLSVGNERITFLYKSPRGPVRQIDILHLSYAQYWSGILYFTGSWSFNETMRGIAKRLGYRLNQSGLYKVRNSHLELIPVNSEREIFEILNIDYVSPEKRY